MPVYLWRRAKESATGCRCQTCRGGARFLGTGAAGILGASEGIITEQHVRWAHAFVKRDVEYKLRVCKAKEASDSHESSVVRDGILDAIRSKLHKDHSITIGRLHNAHRGYSRDTLLAGLEHLVATNEAVADDRTTSKGRTFRHYFAAG